MIKVMVLIKKKPEVSDEQFRHHYETVHAPLIDQLLPFYSAYRRNYIDGAVRRERPEFNWDVITELEFATQDDYNAWLATLEQPEVVAKIRADEAKFLVSKETLMWAVSTHDSDCSR
jgi:uncharacterized protein (TIGR02118 family)